MKYAILLLLLSSPSFADNKYKLFYVDDGEGGKWTYFYKNGHLEDAEHLDARMWTALENHWKYGTPLPGMPGYAIKRTQQVQDDPPPKTSEQLQREIDQSYLSNAMYDALWNELYSFEAQEYYRFGKRGDKRKYRDIYGDTWWKLSRDSRRDWYNYLFPKIDFVEISEWAYKAHIQAENERQEWISQQNALHD